jgi:hypothetical protein
LGSGNITLTANPSGVSGAIQFSNGSAFASDAANFFWDDTNKRLGVGINTPSSKLHIRDTAIADVYLLIQSTQSRTSGVVSQNSSSNWFAGTAYTAPNAYQVYDQTNSRSQLTMFNNGNSQFSISSAAMGAKLGIQGSGSTSATTSLLVQNSGGFSSLLVRDDNVVQGFDSASGVRFQLGNVTNGQGISTRNGNFAVGFIDSGQTASLRFLVVGSGASYIDGYTEGGAKAQNFPIFFGSRVNNVGVAIANVTTQENGAPVIFGSAVSDASALVQINSTTRGFLPPRMTTTQKNAIASPASGLVLYDSTTNKLQCYNGSTWNDLF